MGSHCEFIRGRAPAGKTFALTLGADSNTCQRETRKFAVDVKFATAERHLKGAFHDRDNKWEPDEDPYLHMEDTLPLAGVDINGSWRAYAGLAAGARRDREFLMALIATIDRGAVSAGRSRNPEFVVVRHGEVIMRA